MSEIPLPLKAGPMSMQEQYLATHKTGEIVLDDSDNVITAEALFDTGCQDANYVSSDFLGRHKEALAPFLTSCAYRVYFGDRTTFQDIRQQLILPLRCYSLLSSSPPVSSTTDSRALLTSSDLCPKHPPGACVEFVFSVKDPQ